MHSSPRTHIEPLPPHHDHASPKYIHRLAHKQQRTFVARGIRHSVRAHARLALAQIVRIQRTWTHGGRGIHGPRQLGH